MTEAAQFCFRVSTMFLHLRWHIPLCALDVYASQWAGLMQTQLSGPSLSPPYACLSHEMHTGQIDILPDIWKLLQWVSQKAHLCFPQDVRKKLNKFLANPILRIYLWLNSLQNQIHKDSNQWFRQLCLFPPWEVHSLWTSNEHLIHLWTSWLQVTASSNVVN